METGQTFSILERIDDVVTEVLHLEGNKLLNFQYPRTDRRCCDRARITTKHFRTAPFSILERIDDVVTLAIHVLEPGYTIFQYPRTDRRCCDLWNRRMKEKSMTPFSILERIDDVVTQYDANWPCGFQYPRTDRRCCDAIRCRRCQLAMWLSVSSNGSTML